MVLTEKFAPLLLNCFLFPFRNLQMINLMSLNFLILTHFMKALNLSHTLIQIFLLILMSFKD